MSETNWHGKPYYSLDAWCKNTYQHKCYKIALNAHMTCPNRDGSLDTRGCIFCSAGGSGDFAVELPAAGSVKEDIGSQLSAGIRLIEGKNPEAPLIIAYFQAYTNTYAPVSYLRPLFFEAIRHPGVVALSIGTRPDCLGEDVLTLLSELNTIKPVWVELGLQTIHADTAAYIRRGYPLSTFEAAVKNLHARNLEVIVHTILGLPGESSEQMLETINYLNCQPIQGIKLQLLHVLKGTDLADDYLAGKFQTLSREEYLDLLISCLEHLSPDLVIHRVTGDGPKNLLIAPLWSSAKRSVLNDLHHMMKVRNTWQGRLYKEDLYD